MEFEASIERGHRLCHLHAALKNLFSMGCPVLAVVSIAIWMLQDLRVRKKYATAGLHFSIYMQMAYNRQGISTLVDIVQRKVPVVKGSDLLLTEAKGVAVYG